MGWGGQWGAETIVEPAGGSQGWLGWGTGQSGLMLLGYRFYSPDTGRFLTRDPIGYEGGINPYAYCRDNPIMYSDPSGRDALILYGRNAHPIDGKKDPNAWKRIAQARAKEYIQDSQVDPGGYPHPVIRNNSMINRKAYVVQALQFNDVQNALKTHKNIDSIIYVGHASGVSCCLSDYNLRAVDVDKLYTGNVLPDCFIELDGCHTGDGGGTGADRGLKSIAQAFADHFHARVLGYSGGVGFWGNHPRTGGVISLLGSLLGKHQPASEVWFYPKQ